MKMLSVSLLIQPACNAHVSYVFEKPIRFLAIIHLATYFLLFQRNLMLSREERQELAENAMEELATELHRAADAMKVDYSDLVGLVTSWGSSNQ